MKLKAGGNRGNGQVLSRQIAELGIYPAVDPLDSTSGQPRYGAPLICRMSPRSHPISRMLVDFDFGWFWWIQDPDALVTSMSISGRECLTHQLWDSVTCQHAWRLDWKLSESLYFSDTDLFCRWYWTLGRNLLKTFNWCELWGSQVLKHFETTGVWYVCLCFPFTNMGCCSSAAYAHLCPGVTHRGSKHLFRMYLLVASNYGIWSNYIWCIYIYMVISTCIWSYIVLWSVVGIYIYVCYIQLSLAVFQWCVCYYPLLAQVLANWKRWPI